MKNNIKYFFFDGDDVTYQKLLKYGCKKNIKVSAAVGEEQ